MAITDLLPTGSISRLLARRGSGTGGDASLAGTAWAPGAVPPGAVPPDTSADPLFVGVPLPPAAASVMPTVRAVPPPRHTRAARRPLPSRAILAIGTLSLTCVTLLAALVLTAAAGTPAASGAPPDAVPAGTVPADAPPALPAAGDGPASDVPADAAFASVPTAESGVDAQPVPPDLLASLEAAADAPLPTELALFLRAAQHGFGDRSARLDPSLQSHAYRLASRFEWNPDSYTIAVAAPTLALAQERAARLSQLFSAAVASGRLTIRPSAGPHALSLVTE